MTFRQLLGRLGAREVARRAGVTEGTVKRWKRDGLSRSGKEILRQVAARSERAQAAREARELQELIAEQERARVGEERRDTRARREAFRERIADASDVAPEEAPRAPPATRKTPDYVPPGHKEIDTFRYQGETITVTMAQPIGEISSSAIGQMCVDLWLRAQPFRNFCRVVFLFFRFISGMTHYRGKLVPRDGKWIDWWASTKVQSSEAGIGDNVESVLDEADSGRWSSGVVWLEQIQVNLFEYKEDLPTLEQLTRSPL
jgi:hypothetical protein